MKEGMKGARDETKEGIKRVGKEGTDRSVEG